MSHSKVYLGCSIDAGKSWFVQLVGPGNICNRRVISSGFGVDEDNAIVIALENAGLNEAALCDRTVRAVNGVSDTLIRAPRAPTGIMAAISTCSAEIEQLCLALKLH